MCIRDRSPRDPSSAPAEVQERENESCSSSDRPTPSDAGTPEPPLIEVLPPSFDQRSEILPASGPQINSEARRSTLMDEIFEAGKEGEESDEELPSLPFLS